MLDRLHFLHGTLKFDWLTVYVLLGYVWAVWQYAWHHKGLVSERDPRKIGKEGLVNGAGWKCTLWNVRNFITCWACRVFCWTRHKYKRSILPTWCLQLSKTKQNAKTVLVQLAIPINAHQNANQANQKCTCIPGAVYTSAPSHLSDLRFSIFWGSGSDTNEGWELKI